MTHDRPVCKICGKPHLASEDHNWEGRGFRVVPRSGIEPKRAVSPRKDVPRETRPVDVIPEKPPESRSYSKGYPAVRKWRSLNPEKYRAYMMAYMTERRKRKEPE